MSAPRALASIAIGLILAAGGWFVPSFLSGSSRVPDDQLQEMVFVDPKSGEAFLLPAREAIEFHPETGEQSLVPALYCSKCQAWKAVGSMENLQINPSARMCPVHRIPLIQDGPLPDNP